VLIWLVDRDPATGTRHQPHLELAHCRMDRIVLALDSTSPPPPIDQVDLERRG
jgi:hypothetical protein